MMKTTTTAFTFVASLFILIGAEYHFDPVNFVQPLVPKEKMCSRHTATTTLTNVSILECAVECMTWSSCESFNYVDSSTTLCQMFNYTCVGFEVVSGCLYYQKSSQLTVSTTNIASGKTVTASKDCTLTNSGNSQTLTDGMPPDWLSHTCSCCNDPANGPNWFVVDLGTSIQLAYVILYNRNDMYGQRMNYFIIGISTTFTASTWKAQPSSVTYQVCGHYPQPTLVKGRYIIMCPRPPTPATYGQYVVAQQPQGGVGYFTICEIEIFAYDSSAQNFGPSLI